MDLKAEYLSETCSDPIEFLRQLRQTTEPIGGSTIYDEDGELVEYDIAIEAVRKANNASIDKACEWLNKELPITDLSPSNMLDITFKVFDKKNKKVFIESFKEYMKGE